ncbi:MAG: NfeD family protein [Lachnospiraceae bacterium]|nr:NfeD family protein [Lachnospiraceae bacterium]
MTMIWLVILVGAIVIEIATLGLTTIWFAGGALVAFLLSLLNLPVALQIAAFLIVSIVLLYFTRPIAVRYFNKDRVRTNSEALVGQQAIVVSDINNIEGLGRVLIQGKEWTARAAVDGEKIPAGAVVEVSAIEGVKLLVKQLNDNTQ